MAWMSTLASRRRREEAGFRWRGTYIMGRERHALEDAVDAALGAAADVRELVELHEEVVADGRPSPV